MGGRAKPAHDTVPQNLGGLFELMAMTLSRSRRWKRLRLSGYFTQAACPQPFQPSQQPNPHLHGFLAAL